MSELSWEPRHKRPEDAEDIEAAIARLAPGAHVKLTWLEDYWLVRALAPAATCSRGPSAEARDVSQDIADLLIDAGHRASVRRRQG